MKNQYFGDVNDYRKYGLLRVLAGDGEFRTAVCWMLTKNDDSRDGGNRGYLDKPKMWERYDPELFRELATCRRSVQEAEKRQIIPRAVYFERPLTDNSAVRKRYFVDFLREAVGCELVFFDPDNGLDVKSVPRGRKGSCKYLYPDELKQAFDAGHSVLVYQHYPFLKRHKYHRMQAKRLCKLLSVPSVWLFSTPYVLFLLVPQRRHMEYLAQKADEFGERWSGPTAGISVSPLVH